MYVCVRQCFPQNLIKVLIFSYKGVSISTVPLNIHVHVVKVLNAPVQCTCMLLFL